MIKQLLAKVQSAERATIAALATTASDNNFETAVDKLYAAQNAAQSAESALQDEKSSIGLKPDSWQGDPAFALGSYAEVDRTDIFSSNIMPLLQPLSLLPQEMRSRAVLAQFKPSTKCKSFKIMSIIVQ